MPLNITSPETWCGSLLSSCSQGGWLIALRWEISPSLIAPSLRKHSHKIWTIGKWTNWTILIWLISNVQVAGTGKFCQHPLDQGDAAIWSWSLSLLIMSLQCHLSQVVKLPKIKQTSHALPLYNIERLVNE